MDQLDDGLFAGPVRKHRKHSVDAYPEGFDSRSPVKRRLRLDSDCTTAYPSPATRPASFCDARSAAYPSPWSDEFLLSPPVAPRPLPQGFPAAGANASTALPPPLPSLPGTGAQALAEVATNFAELTGQPSLLSLLAARGAPPPPPPLHAAMVPASGFTDAQFTPAQLPIAPPMKDMKSELAAPATPRTPQRSRTKGSCDGWEDQQATNRLLSTPSPVRSRRNRSPPSAPGRRQSATAAPPLMRALCSSGSAAMDAARAALESDPEAARFPFWDHDCEPPLCFAVRRGCDVAMIELLLQYGADPEAVDNMGRAPLAILHALPRPVNFGNIFSCDADLIRNRELIEEVLIRASGFGIALEEDAVRA